LGSLTGRILTRQDRRGREKERHGGKEKDLQTGVKE